MRYICLALKRLDIITHWGAYKQQHRKYFRGTSLEFPSQESLRIIIPFEHVLKLISRWVLNRWN